MKRLPAKASALIRLAVADLEAVEKNPVYAVNMGAWHEPNVLSPHRRGKWECAVCFAGAVMANSLGALPANRAGPKLFDEITAGKLCALDGFRAGYLSFGLEKLGVSFAKRSMFPSFYDITDYSSNPKKFKTDMRRLATKLEKAGL